MRSLWATYDVVWECNKTCFCYWYCTFLWFLSRKRKKLEWRKKSHRNFWAKMTSNFSCNIHHEQLIMCTFRHASKQQGKFLNGILKRNMSKRKVCRLRFKLQFLEHCFQSLWSAYFYSLMNFSPFSMQYVCACCHLMHAWDLLTFSKQLEWMMWELRQIKDCLVLFICCLYCVWLLLSFRSLFINK